MQGRLPELVLRRQVQADFMPIFASEVNALNGQQPLPGTAIGARGWIIPSELSALLQKVRAGDTHYLWNVWAAIGIEIWSRRI